MSSREWEEQVSEQIQRNQAMLDENGAIIDRWSPPQYRHLSPKAMGILDSLDQLACRPSTYYCRRRQIVEYILGYISVKPGDRDARILGATYGIQEIIDGLQEDDLAVDDAQSERCDWRI